MDCQYSKKNGWIFTFKSGNINKNVCIQDKTFNLCIQDKTFTFLEKIGFGQGLKILIEGNFTREINLIESKTQFNQPKLYLVFTPSTRYALKELMS
jgi:hypothetical protein